MSQANTMRFIKDLDDEDFVLNNDDTVIDEGPVFNNLFKEYEKVVVRSLITSFGLDVILVSDRRGGDVDTIHTVRDSSVKDYADKRNADDFNNRGVYNSELYHRDKNYISKNREVSKQKKSGNLIDAYTGKKIPINAKVDLDHTISAKEIHDDPGRVLAGLSGSGLANKETNLNATDQSINRSKQAKTSEEFLKKLDQDKKNRQHKISELKNKSNLTDNERKQLEKLEKLESVNAERVKEKDAKARAAYESELARTYYTSNKFLKATATASLVKGSQMGLRQCLGMILTEVWFTIKEEFPRIVNKLKNDFELSEFLKAIADTTKKAFNKIKDKYKELIASFKEGMLAGIISSISSTLINIFFTTAKSVGRILRESWASIVEAIRILVFNPDNLPFGEMIRAVAKILAVSVSVICGALVQEGISKMNPVKLPIIVDVLPAFIGSMVTGIMTVSMLYFLDYSKIVQNIVEFANKMKDEFDHKLDYFRTVNKQLTEYVAKLAMVDYELLEKEVSSLKTINIRLNATTSLEELNMTLHQIIKEKHIELPYESLEELDEFMTNKNSVLVI